MAARRITIIITGLGIGGAEHALLKLLAARDPSRIEVSLLVLGRLDSLAPQFRAIGVEPVFLGLAAGRWPFAAVGRLIAAVRSTEPELIQGWMYHGNLAASFVGARLKVPVCWSVRDTPDAAHGHSLFTRLTIALSRLYVGRVAHIFNVSTRSAAYCAEHLGWPAARTEVLPNGLDVSHFRPDPERRRAARSAWGVAGDETVIGIVARWSPVKNHRLFLEAAAQLLISHPRCRFVMIGKDLDRDNAELAAWLAELGLADRVLLLGPRHDVETLYPGLDFLALTSRSEGFPNVLAEAMACGVPVVCTDVGDAREIVGEGGRIAAAEPRAFAAALAGLIDSPELDRIQTSARAHIVGHYAITGIAERLQSRYEALASA
ncbi:glycosyltransferase [Niveibacterium terrae]|uniref:glycosyltransferase n=1 Tax=Niveibacterium terrae TaxID=3373598 RepID=UPI003A8EA78B